MKTKKTKGKNNTGRPPIEIKENILVLLKDSDKPLSTTDFSNKLERAWHTIDRNCLKLQIDGKIEGFKIGRMDLWRLK